MIPVQEFSRVAKLCHMLSQGLQSISSQNTAPLQPPLIMYCRSTFSKEKEGFEYANIQRGSEKSVTS